MTTDKEKAALLRAWNRQGNVVAVLYAAGFIVLADKGQGVLDAIRRELDELGSVP